MSRALQEVRRTACVAVAAALFFMSPVHAADEATPNDVARFLAGMPAAPGSPLAAFAGDPSWSRHAKSMDATWRSLQNRQLSRIAAWTKTNITERKPTTFYMFSGPDFLYANAFFPGSATYVMSGLEPVGRLPDPKYISRRTVSGVVGHLQASIRSITNVSFFLTKQMHYQLRSSHFDGTLPILYAFLARADKTITDVSFFTLEPDGTAKPTDGTPVRNAPNGVKIAFTGEGGQAQTLYYFSTDVSNGGVKSSGFLQFCEKLAPGDAFVKSASYLMHSDSFSTVREFLLANVTTLVQDDTGLPIRFFNDDWKLRPYGRYLGPIPLFGGRYQSKLSELFRKERATPIDFGVGYRWGPNESNLLLATRQQRKAALDGR